MPTSKAIPNGAVGTFCHRAICLLALERLTDEELERLEKAFVRMREKQGGGNHAIEQIAEVMDCLLGAGTGSAELIG